MTSLATLARTAGGLLTAAVLLTSCGGDGGAGADGGAGGAGGNGRDTGTSVEATGAADAQTVTVDSNDRLEFEPATVRARVGTLTLIHRNAGQIPHNLTFEDDALGATETIGGGKQESLTVTFSKPGTYTFVCTIHSGQQGKVVVS